MFRYALVLFNTRSAVRVIMIGPVKIVNASISIRASKSGEPGEPGSENNSKWL